MTHFFGRAFPRTGCGPRPLLKIYQIAFFNTTTNNNSKCINTWYYHVCPCFPQELGLVILITNEESNLSAQSKESPICQISFYYCLKGGYYSDRKCGILQRNMPEGNKLSTKISTISPCFKNI